MTDWGPGPADEPVRREESAPEGEEVEEGLSVSSEQGSSQESPQSPHEQIREEDDARPGNESVKWHHGTVDDVLRAGEYAFLPVFGFNEGHVAVRRYAERRAVEDPDFVDDDSEDEPTLLAGKELSWWEKNSIMPQHPFMLINPVGFTTADADQHDFRDLFRTQKGEQFVFSDSGGYQIMSMDDAEIVASRDDHAFQDLNVYPERLLEWQVENADAGATIDFPPYNISGDANFPDKTEHTAEWREFYELRREKSADMAARMGERLQQLREEEDPEAEDYIFAPVIHGKPHPDDDTKYLSMWHGKLVKEMDFWPRGWVLKPEPSHNFGQIAMHLGYATECLTERSEYIHVLMVGGLLQKTLLMYFAMNSDVMVTSDASSYAAGGKRRQFDLPKTARRRAVIISNRSEEEREDATMDATRLDRYPCRCQVCATVEREEGFEFVTEGTGSARNATLNLHNLHQALSVERTLDALLREEDTQIVETDGDPTGSEFWRYIKTIAPEKKVDDLYRAMDFVRLAQQHGLDNAQRRYRIPWDARSGRTILPASESGADDSWAN